MLIKLFAKTVFRIRLRILSCIYDQTMSKNVKGDTGYTRKALDQSRSSAQNLGS
ncbi:hypothetical protein HanRHA438_Chr08g0342821 [Helianthus annuus]|nr:hypothetical protein HanRHA438_Chr08g0342821 [Helianthus annuus]